MFEALQIIALIAVMPYLWRKMWQGVDDLSEILWRQDG